MTAALHYRDGGPPPPGAYKEMMDMAAATNAKYEVSHLNIAGTSRGDAPPKPVPK